MIVYDGAHGIPRRGEAVRICGCPERPNKEICLR